MLGGQRGSGKIFPNPQSRDLTCHSPRNDSYRDRQWLGLDGIAQDNGHGLAGGKPKLGIFTVDAVGRPCQSTFPCVSRLDCLTF